MNPKKFIVIGLAVLSAALTYTIIDAQGPTGGRRSPSAVTVGTGFSYQGQLKSGGALVNGTCTLAFRMYDDVSAGSQIGSAITQTIPITSGLFTTQLNTSSEFGATAFNGDARWLEIRVSTACPSAGSYTTLVPREPLTPAPYALTAMKTAYKNVLVVAKSGGHYNTISAALTSITDNSVNNPYLIWVAPGIYTETVTMKQYVDIEGAGELATKISQVGGANVTLATVSGADNAESRFLSIENTGGSTYAVAIYNGGTSPRLMHVTASASGGVTNYGVFNSVASPTMTYVTAEASGGTNSYAVSNGGGSPTMTNVIATASGGSTSNYGVSNSNASAPTMANVIATASGGSSSYGIYNSGSSPTMTNVTAAASAGVSNYGVTNLSSSITVHTSVLSGSGGTNNYGIYNSAASGTFTVTVNHSQVKGSTNTVRNDTEFTTLIGASKLDGGAVTGAGTLTCAGVYDEAYAFSASTCP